MLPSPFEPFILDRITLNHIESSYILTKKELKNECQLECNCTTAQHRQSNYEATVKLLAPVFAFLYQYLIKLFIQMQNDACQSLLEGTKRQQICIQFRRDQQFFMEVNPQNSLKTSTIPHSRARQYDYFFC